MGFYSIGERIGDGSCKHGSNMFIGDIYIYIYIYGDLLAILMICSLQIRPVPHVLIY